MKYGKQREGNGWQILQMYVDFLKSRGLIALIMNMGILFCFGQFS